ncbi:uncharacterized protein LOC132752082 [Ruditapes philippinarum]|uniref:uncharacterized protein LOC132752082 n=1 Tax=Ruditapes philippinarum TaxID=129788 RepID=UPI00295ACB39|nr:uncharacterized protein LOC132752082 [Ruditapes philippinarum]
MFDDASNSISQKNVIAYGYVTKNGSLLLLSFTENHNNKKRYLLQTPSVPKPTSDQLLTSTYSQMSETTHWNNTITINATIRTFSASQAMTSTLTSASSISQPFSTYLMNDTFINSTEGFRSKLETRTESSNVSIPVSITVAVITLVAVVVIITLIRRGKLEGICNKNSNTENSTKGIVITDKISAQNNVYNEPAISDYEQISELKDNNNVDIKADLDEGNGNYGQTYFVLEPGSRESHTDGDMSDSMKEETEMNDDYNTLHLNKTFGAKADDTYDTTEKAAIKLKALQNTGCEKEFLGKLNENEEDTYNHISRNLFKNNKTDNIYGVTDNQENDYGDVNNGCEKNLRDGDDTYSHLNTTH